MSAKEGNAPPTGQATAPAPTTKPAKDPKRVAARKAAAGKATAQKTEEACEVQKKALADAEERVKKAEGKAARAAEKEPAVAPNPVRRPATEEKLKSDSGGLNKTQWLTLGSIAVGLIGIYYKNKELKAAFKSGGIAPSTIRRQNQQMVEQPNPETARGLCPLPPSSGDPSSGQGTAQYRGCHQME